MLRQGFGDPAQRSPGHRGSIRGDRRAGEQQGVPGPWSPSPGSVKLAAT
jgi:hypothetical protein